MHYCGELWLDKDNSRFIMFVCVVFFFFLSFIYKLLRAHTLSCLTQHIILESTWHIHVNQYIYFFSNKKVIDGMNEIQNGVKKNFLYLSVYSPYSSCKTQRLKLIYVYIVITLKILLLR